jgi:hypothetical protein
VNAPVIFKIATENGTCESSCHFQVGDGRLEHVKAPVIFKMATGDRSM